MWKRKESLNLKIATYNIWNSESGMPYRIKYIVNEIKLINADVICLQEVSSRKLAEGIAANADYPYWYFDNSQKIAVVNVLLPWDSVLIREHQIIKIVNAVDKKHTNMFIWRVTLIVVIFQMYSGFC